MLQRLACYRKSCRIGCMNDLHETQKQLLAAKSAINAALRALKNASSSEVRENVEAYGQRICPWCKKPIKPDDRLKRGLHHNCYYQMYRSLVATGESSLEELEAAGILEPKKSGGRPPESHVERALEIKEAIRRKRNKKIKD